MSDNVGPLSLIKAQHYQRYVNSNSVYILKPADNHVEGTQTKYQTQGIQNSVIIWSGRKEYLKKRM